MNRQETYFFAWGIASLFKLLKKCGAFSEKLDLFLPQGWFVQDSSGGTLAIAMAAAALIRQYFIVEEEKDCVDAAIQRLYQFTNRITSIRSGGHDDCGLDEHKTKNILAGENGFGEDPILECKGTYDCFELEHASVGSSNESANGSCLSVSDLVGTASVSVKGLHRTDLKRIVEDSSNEPIFTDAVGIEEERNVAW